VPGDGLHGASADGGEAPAGPEAPDPPGSEGASAVKDEDLREVDLRV